MKINKNKITALAGDKILTTPHNIQDNNLENVIRTELLFIIDDLYEEGKYAFLTSLEPGFGMLAAEVVLEYAKTHKSVKLYIVIPFAGHELCFSDNDKLRYKHIFDLAADYIFIDNDGYSEKAYDKTSTYLCDNSSEIIVYCSDLNSSLIVKANGAKINMLNLYEEMQDYFSMQHPLKQYMQAYASVTSFKYIRMGILIAEDNMMIIAEFNEMLCVREEKDELCFFLRDGTLIRASLCSDNVKIIPPKYLMN